MTRRPEVSAALGPAGTATPSRSGDRIAAIDNLKALLVSLVIVGHALVGYAAIGGWPYDEVQEGTLPPAVEYVLAILFGPTALCAMGTFFFVSGLFAPAAVAKAGPGRYARGRLIRLGIPWIAFMLLIWPFFMWLAYRAAGNQLTLWQVFLARTPFLDSGPIWFVQVLLYACLAYALWSASGWDARLAPAALGWRHLLLAAGCIAVLSFAIRLLYPARSQQILDLHLWQWPQLMCMFALGTLAGRHGWARSVPDSIVRRCCVGIAVLAGLVPILLWSLQITSFLAAEPLFVGGWRWQALLLDLVEGALAVFGTIVVVRLAQRHLVSVRPFARLMARSAYAAFLLQVPMLIGWEIIARPLPVPIVVKAVGVAVLAVSSSFGLAALLVSRTPLRRVV